MEGAVGQEQMMPVVVEESLQAGTKEIVACFDDAQEGKDCWQASVSPSGILHGFFFFVCL